MNIWKSMEKRENQFCTPMIPLAHLKSFSRTDSGKCEPFPPICSDIIDKHLMSKSHSMESLNTIGSNGTADANEPVKTLFVSGLPMDTKPRELYLLFRVYKGYICSTLKLSGRNGKVTAPVGFVTFSSRDFAEEALNDLQGTKFDPEAAQQMRLEFARSNTKVTKPNLGFISPTQQYANAGNSPHPVLQQFPGFFFDSVEYGHLLPNDSAWSNLGYDNGILTSAGILPSNSTTLHPSIIQVLISQGGLMTRPVSSNNLPSSFYNSQNVVNSQSSFTSPYLTTSPSQLNGSTISYPGLLPLGFPPVGLLNYNALMKDLVKN